MNLKGEGARLDFLGYTYRYDRDLYGRAQRYRNVIPSKKALQREQEQLRAMTNVDAESQAPCPTDCRAESAPERLPRRRVVGSFPTTLPEPL